MRLIPTILCGGAGSRLWPVSRELHPKPFIRLADGQSLLQKAFLRGAQLPGVAEILTVTNRELFFKTEDEFREMDATGVATSFILEPFGRNTAAAIAAAALQVAVTYGKDAVMLVLAADHLIANDEHTLPTPHPKLRIAQARSVDAEWLMAALDWLMQDGVVAEAEVKQKLREWVPEYTPK